MMGLDEIRKANENPTAFAKSRLSDGQKRRNDAAPSNYWSEMEPEHAPVVCIDNRLPSGKLPEDYFDAVKLLQALAVTVEQGMHITRSLADAIVLARRPDATPDDVAQLKRVIAAISNRNPVVDLHLLLKGLSDYVDTLAPVKIGYNSRDGLTYAAHPIRGFISKMETALQKLALV